MNPKKNPIGVFGSKRNLRKFEKNKANILQSLLNVHILIAQLDLNFQQNEKTHDIGNGNSSASFPKSIST